jgi:CheY-like chemotaxis protein
MGKTLLLADDSVTIQKVVGISFASEDIAIKTVDNGDDAISRARELRPDVILADVVMPGKSGYEVCEAIKADPALRHIPVLLLTGTFEAFDEQRATRAGAAGHVAKPFEAQTLVERVKGLLAQAANPAPAAPPVQAAPAAPARPAPAARPAAAPAAPARPATPARPTAAPAATPPPAPAPARGGADHAFDFFDDPADGAPVVAATDAARADLEVEPPDAVFAFGEDELSSPEPEFLSASAPPLARATAHTVAILPGDAPERAGTARPLPPPVSPPPVPPRAAAPAPKPPADFDFEFESVGAAKPAARAREVDTSLAEATLLDPTGSSAFDVSSSELDSLIATREPVAASAAATQLIDHPFAPETADDFVEEVPSVPPGSAADVDLVTPDVLEDDAGWSEQAIETEPDLAPPPRKRPEAPRSEARPSDASAGVRPPSQPGRMTDDALAQIAPALREQLHETLEKIAWEAFGNVTEAVVEQAVERLEKIAWEVVPKLAETLILEEIRKLKAE